MRKINIQKDVESRKKISLSLPAIVSYDMMEETKTAELSDEPENEIEDAQSEIIQEQEVNQVTDQQETAKKGGRKAKGNV
ncbi:hypothetical protein [Dysgonomonas sp. ZJ709]|uniref:hypothetical protein n=1 Tax=Dysgonomonas sp. ZJ709 TaxID=2709797 RepID=UPI0013EAB9E4|nr:hypothetical protein [Dysgonomonas sp. ZJ709]